MIGQSQRHYLFTCFDFQCVWKNDVHQTQAHYSCMHVRGSFCVSLTTTDPIAHQRSVNEDMFRPLTTLIRHIPGVVFSMNMLIWFVNSTTENAVSAAVVGLTFGPIFAGTLGLCNDVLPKEVHMVSMAILWVAFFVQHSRNG